MECGRQKIERKKMNQFRWDTSFGATTTTPYCKYIGEFARIVKTECGILGTLYSIKFKTGKYIL
jgi:hypothetical protein